MGITVLVAASVSIVVASRDGNVSDARPASMATSVVTPAPPTAPSLQSVVDFNTAATGAIAPLLAYVRTVPNVLTAAGKGTLGVSQRRGLGVMAEQFAVARDQVLRVPVGPGVAVQARDLMAIGSQFYRESVLTLATLPAPGDGAPRVMTAKAAAMLRELGDRAFDGYRRLLGVDGTDEDASITYFYPPPVPALSGLPVTTPVGAAPADQTGALVRARDLLDQLTTRRASEAPLTPTAPDLRAAAQFLQTENSADEAVISARLAVLTALLAETAESAGRMASADDLLLLSSELWRIGSELPGQGTRLGSLGPPAVSRERAWDGGDTADPTAPVTAVPRPGDGQRLLPEGMP